MQQSLRDMTTIEKIEEMMKEAYERYKTAMKDQSDANKYRANFWKGKYEGHRESLEAIKQTEQP